MQTDIPITDIPRLVLIKKYEIPLVPDCVHTHDVLMDICRDDSDFLKQIAAKRDEKPSFIIARGNTTFEVRQEECAWEIRIVR
ncbi:MAG: hypothetical protein V4509_04105 [Patescibacteria group bacterium]